MSYRRRNRWSSLYALLLLIPVTCLYPFLLGIQRLPIDSLELLRDSIVLSAFIFAFAYVTVMLRSKIRQVVVGPVLGLFALWIGAGFIVTWDLNARLDKSPLMSVVVEVNQVKPTQKSGSKIAGCNIQVPSWRPGVDWEIIRGNSRVCQKMTKGRQLEILFKKGYFGYTYIKGARVKT